MPRPHRRSPAASPRRRRRRSIVRAPSGRNRRRRQCRRRRTRNAVELGVKFRTTTDGFITGIRFYKGPANTGVHTARLWTCHGHAAARQPRSLAKPQPAGSRPSSARRSPSRRTPSTSRPTTRRTAATPPRRPPSLRPGVITPPLEALSSAASGGNGVYRYGPPAFPNQTFNAANYWVDVVFVTSVAPDTTAPQVLNTLPLAAAASTSGPRRGDVQRVDEPSIDQRRRLRAAHAAQAHWWRPTCRTTPSPARPSLQPQAPLAHETAYTAVVRGGSTGVRDLAGNALAVDHSWTFTTIGTPAPAAGTGPGGPVLVITSSSRPVLELLHGDPPGRGAECLHGRGPFGGDACAAVAARRRDSRRGAAVGRRRRDVHGVGHRWWQPDRDAAGQAARWPARPDRRQRDPERRLPPGADRQRARRRASLADTMQFHGTADRYTPNGASVVATLFSSATATTSNPAVTVRSVGTRGRAGRRLHLSTWHDPSCSRARATPPGPARSAMG